MKTTVVIPTFNEKENIAALIDRINALGIKGLEILVVDDDSSDGTWKTVEEKKREAPNLRLMRRFGEKGRGAAVREGFMDALRSGSRAVVEMDGDLSHTPESIPALLEALREADAAVGSRFVAGGGIERKSAARNLISRAARLYLRLVLGYRIMDPTSGFRCFSRRALESINPPTLRAAGPFGVTEILYRCHRKGLRIKEVPITFMDRAGGCSKLGGCQLIQYLFSVLRLRTGRF